MAMIKENMVKVLNSDLRYMYLVSIISADSNYDKESVLNNIERLNQIKSVINDENLLNREEIADFVESGLEVLYRDLNNFC